MLSCLSFDLGIFILFSISAETSEGKGEYIYIIILSSHFRFYLT